MRSRYTAFVLGVSGYLEQTWHPSTRPAPLALEGGPRWVRLEVRSVDGGGAEDDEGRVEFAAHYRDSRGAGTLHETSHFLREDGRWFYVDGEIHPAPKAGQRTGRNDPCPCGSGRKFKQCCGR